MTEKTVIYEQIAQVSVLVIFLLLWLKKKHDENQSGRKSLSWLVDGIAWQQEQEAVWSHTGKRESNLEEGQGSELKDCPH